MNTDRALQVAFATFRSGQTAAAEAGCRQILASNPDHAETHHLLGIITLATERSKEAVDWLRRAAKLSPDRGDILANLGIAYRRSGLAEQAATSLRQAAVMIPDSAEVQMNLGEALHSLGHFGEAIACGRRALALRPNYPGALNNLGNALVRQGHWPEAMECFHRALALRPDFAEAYNSLGNALLEAGQFDQALASFLRALELKPTLADAYGNIGTVWLELGQPGNGLAFFRDAIARNPEFAPAHCAFALFLLRLGRFEEGWNEYQWRWHDKTRDPNRPAIAMWAGDPIPARTLRVRCEQGFGDAIQFLRYLPLACGRAAAQQIRLECPRELARLFARNTQGMVTINSRENEEGSGIPNGDEHIPLMSLPFALGHLAPFATAGPYLVPDPSIRAAWNQRLLATGGLRIGIAWAGNPVHIRDSSRSIDPSLLAPLLRVPGATFYSLQVKTGVTSPNALGDLGLIDQTPDFTDFDDTAALLAELDLIISVDTAVAHLAGALAQPVWTLLPHIADWRWGLEGASTPWYPTMRLFRQRVSGDWPAVIQQVAQELETLCCQSRPSGLPQAT